MIPRRRLLINLLCACLVLGVTMTGYAYIPPAEQILGYMIKQFGPDGTFKVLQKTIIYDPSLEGGIRELDETLYYRYPDQFRCEVNTPGVEQVRVVGPGGAISVTNGKIVAESENAFDHFKDLFLYRDVGLLLNRLSQTGVNLDVVSLGRHKNAVAYVIGANYPDKSLPQVWVEDGTFRPIRYVLRDGGFNDAGLTEIEYADYTLLDEDRWYPSRILFYTDGRLARMYVLKTHAVNPDVPDQLFDIAYLRTVYEPIASTQPAPSTASDLDEVSKAIRDFGKTFE